MFLNFSFANDGGDTRPYLMVRVFGVSLRGLLDSGASRTIIGRPGWEVLRSWGLKMNKSVVRKVSLADGEQVAVLGGVSLPIE